VKYAVAMAHKVSKLKEMMGAAYAYFSWCFLDVLLKEL
jgi:hypothetical protein